MSVCISSHGEYSSHHPGGDGDAFCEWCGAFDQDYFEAWVRADERARIAEAIRENPLYRTAEARELSDPNAYVRRCAYDHAARIAAGTPPDPAPEPDPGPRAGIAPAYLRARGSFRAWLTNHPGPATFAEIDDLHAPAAPGVNTGGRHEFRPGEPHCPECGDGEWEAEPWPCPTIRAMYRAAGIKLPDRPDDT